MSQPVPGSGVDPLHLERTSNGDAAGKCLEFGGCASGAEQRGRNDRDPVGTSVSVRPCREHDQVENVVSEPALQPV